MIILIITQYFWPENFRINDLTLNLKKKGHKVSALTGPPNYPAGFDYKSFDSNPKFFLKFNGKILRVPVILRRKSNVNSFLNYNSFALSASNFDLWKIRNKKIDIIFVNQPSPTTVGWPALIVKFIKNVPIAFWVLDLLPDTLFALKIVESMLNRKLISIISTFTKIIYKDGVQH